MSKLSEESQRPNQRPINKMPTNKEKMKEVKYLLGALKKENMALQKRIGTLEAKVITQHNQIKLLKSQMPPVMSKSEFIKYRKSIQESLKGPP